MINFNPPPRSKLNPTQGRLPRLLNVLARWWRPPPIATRRDLADFLRGQAAYIAQKTIDDYCRARVGLFSHALYAERSFLDALAHSRSHGFAAVLADLVVVLEGMLRPHGRVRSEALTDLYRSTLEDTPILTPEPPDWTAAIAEFARRLDQIGSTAPLPAARIAETAGRRIFEALPIHRRYSGNDAEIIANSISFQMVALRERLARRLDLATLAGVLSDPPHP